MNKNECIAFYDLLINTKGNPNTKDFKKNNIPFEYFLRLTSMQNVYNLTNDKIVEIAKKAKNKILSNN